jgi:tetratricopeptide (TPR) repeat protein
VLLVAPSTASADDGALADTLFTEGNTLAAAGKYDEACPKLAESQRLEPAVGTQFNLADCYEHLGRTATAHALFVDVGRIARAAGKFERERVAKERATALLPRLAHLRLVVSAPAPGIDISVDDASIARDRWSSAIPIDPGAHRIVATAPSRTTWAATAQASAGTTSDVAIPELVDPNPPPRADARPPSSTQRSIAIAVGGAGLAGLAVGAIAGAMSLSSRSTAEQACPEATYHFRCPTPQGTDDWNSATTAGNVSTVGFVVGGLALAGAAVLWFTAPSGKVRAGASTTGVRFEGTF